MAVFCLTATLTPAVQAQQSSFRRDFLYKVQSRWSDVTTDGAFLYVTNSTYSQIEKYTVGGVQNTMWGRVGSGDGSLRQPMGLTVGTSTGTFYVYVADTGNNRIQKFNASTGAFVSKWGTYGSGDSQLDHPQGVAVDDAETYLFIADTGNNRIHALDLGSGTFYATGSATAAPGIGPNQFSSPKGIAVFGAAPTFDVFVADTGNNRIVYYTFDTNTHEFTYDSAFGSFGTTSDANNIRFNQPNKINIDKSGNHYLYVTDTTNRIQKFTNGRSFISQWNVHDSKGTTGVTTYYDSGAGSTTLYVIEPAGLPSTTTLEQYNQIDIHNAQTTAYTGSFANESNQPVDIALDSSGNIYLNYVAHVGAGTADSVIKFNSSWAPQYEWTGDGSPFSGALGIGVNTGGEVCVADTGNNRVQRFNTNGGFVAELPDPQATPVGFNAPRDVANEATGKMYVADTDNNRIVKFSSDFPVPTEIWAIGLPTPTFTAPGPGTPTPTTPPGPYFYHPYGITLDAYNKIYVADSGNHRILKFDANGALFTDGGFAGFWGEYGSADNRTQPQFDNPQGMAIGPELPDGYIYVADTGNNRIQRFRQDGDLASRVLWGQYGTEDGQFSQPRNVAVDSSSRVYVSEVTNRRIQVFGDAALNAGLSIVETGGTAVTEDGSVYDSYTVRLLTQPSANVTVTVTASDSAQLSVSSPTLTFTPTNWNVPQVETVIPIHDYIDQATTQHIAITHSVASSDTDYQSGGISLGNVDVTLTDTDTAGVIVSPISGKVAEGGVLEDGSPGEQSASYTIQLTSKPTADVIISATSTDGYTAINPTSRTITPSTWQLPVTFDVTAVNDQIANATRSAYINNIITTSDTSGYQNIDPDDTRILVVVEDFYDQAGITINTDTLGPIDEGGTGASYSIVLNSKPTADVTVNVATLSGTTDVSINPSSVTFTPADWNTVQSVTILAPRDFSVNTAAYRDVYATNSASLSNTDPNYLPGTVQFYVGGTYGDGTVITSIHDVDTAGVVLTETDGLDYLIEGQTDHTYSIALNSRPTGNVVMTTASDTLEATTSAHVHTFTPANWNVPQSVTITSANDNIYQGTHSATLIHTVEHSADPNYAEGSAAIFSYTIYDTDYPGVLFNLPNGVINIQEGGYEDQYYMHLKTEPLADVTINISGGADATITPSSLTFTPANWDQDQIATVSANNNFIVQGARTGTITHTGVSTDPGYDDLSTALIINIADDDNTVPGVQIIQTNGSTEVTEASSIEDTYTLQLTSRPTAWVRIRVLSNNWEATTSAALFTFTPANWNVPQTVHVVSKDDPALDGDRTSIFRHLVTSLDPHYSGIEVDDVFVIAHDNDHTSPAVAPTCGQTPPADIPNLFQIDAGANSATLYYTPIKDNINYYFIAYGYKPGDMRFGVSFPFGSYDGVIDYTINALTPGTKYYFMVRGGNGCATGNWSNSLAATTMASGSAALRSYYGGGTSGYASAGGYSGGSAVTSGTSADGTHPIFARDLYPGSRGADVRSLQIYLNQKGFIVAQSGPGSPGNETDYYGPLTASAIRRFQEAHYAEILSPLGYSSGTGIFGPSTRAYVNAH